MVGFPAPIDKKCVSSLHFAIVELAIQLRKTGLEE
jgi:hypothetical protein